MTASNVVPLRWRRSSALLVALALGVVASAITVRASSPFDLTGGPSGGPDKGAPRGASIWNHYGDNVQTVGFDTLDWGVEMTLALFIQYSFQSTGSIISQGGWYLGYRSDDQTYVAYVDTPTCPSDQGLACVVGTNFVSGVWSHVALRFSGGALSVCIDGTAACSSGSVGSPIANSGVPFRIGSPHDGNGVTVADVRVYRRALSDDEINVLADSSTYPTEASLPPYVNAGVIAMYDFSGTNYLANRASSLCNVSMTASGVTPSVLVQASGTASLTIAGSLFSAWPGVGQVLVNGASTAFSVVSDSQILATVDVTRLACGGDNTVQVVGVGGACSVSLPSAFTLLSGALAAIDHTVLPEAGVSNASNTIGVTSACFAAPLSYPPDWQLSTTCEFLSSADATTVLATWPTTVVSSTRVVCARSAALAPLPVGNVLVRVTQSLLTGSPPSAQWTSASTNTLGLCIYPAPSLDHIVPSTFTSTDELGAIQMFGGNFSTCHIAGPVPVPACRLFGSLDPSAQFVEFVATQPTGDAPWTCVPAGAQLALMAQPSTLGIAMRFDELLSQTLPLTFVAGPPTTATSSFTGSCGLVVSEARADAKTMQRPASDSSAAVARGASLSAASPVVDSGCIYGRTYLYDVHARDANGWSTPIDCSQAVVQLVSSLGDQMSLPLFALSATSCRAVVQIAAPPQSPFTNTSWLATAAINETTQVRVLGAQHVLLMQPAPRVDWLEPRSGMIGADTVVSVHGAFLVARDLSTASCQFGPTATSRALQLLPDTITCAMPASMALPYNVTVSVVLDGVAFSSPALTFAFTESCDCDRQGGSCDNAGSCVCFDGYGGSDCSTDFAGTVAALQSQLQAAEAHEASLQQQLTAAQADEAACVAALTHSLAATVGLAAALGTVLLVLVVAVPVLALRLRRMRHGSEFTPIVAVAAAEAVQYRIQQD